MPLLLPNKSGKRDSNGEAEAELPHKKNEQQLKTVARLNKSGKRDSNPRPSAWEADALPTELLPHFS